MPLTRLARVHVDVVGDPGRELEGEKLINRVPLMLMLVVLMIVPMFLRN